MTIRNGILALVLAMASTTALAQEDAAPRKSYWEDQRTFGLAAQYSAPYGDFGDAYNGGWSIQGLVDHPLFPLLSLIGNVGLHHFPRDGAETSIDVWEVSGGAKINFGAFYMGGQVGWFSEVDETSWVPSMGLRWPRLEVSVNVKAVGGSSWTGVRVGYYFF